MMKIMNKDLFDDPRDAKIAQMRIEIDAFKKYDQRRKDYYKAVIDENKRMRDELNRGRDILREDDKDALIAKLKKQIADVNVAMERKGLTMNGVTDEQLANWRDEINVVSSYTNISKLNAEIKRLRKENKDLVHRLIKYEKDRI